MTPNIYYVGSLKQTRIKSISCYCAPEGASGEVEDWRLSAVLAKETVGDPEKKNSRNYMFLLSGKTAAELLTLSIFTVHPKQKEVFLLVDHCTSKCFSHLKLKCYAWVLQTDNKLKKAKADANMYTIVFKISVFNFVELLTKEMISIVTTFKEK